MVSAENDGKQVIVGGIITDIRTILTKSNTKMAFVKIESKTAETEFIVFPSLYEQEGPKLVVDNIIKVTGRVNARDKDGNMTSDVKIIADSFSVVSDDKLENYQSTGIKLEDPKDAPYKEFKSRNTSVPENIASRLSGDALTTKEKTTNSKVEKNTKTKTKPESVSESTAEAVRRIVTPPVDPRSQKLFVLIENPEDTEKLTRIRKLCDDNPGFQEIILVLKDETGKKPLRMPFRIDASSELIEPLKSLVGESGVVLK